MVLSLLFAAGILSDTDLGLILRNLTMLVAWVSVALGLIRVLACLTPRRVAAAPIAEHDLPDYTILLPLFREAHMVDGLVHSLTALDYPKDKLDIILICEACDALTIRRAQQVAKPPFRVLIVPETDPGGEPQTKPRALNYALSRSRGELVTIFDAEDRPHPDQLRDAASAFAAHPDWVALQAPLLYFNTSDSRLAAQFGLEYAGLFTVLLPFYDRAGLPFPLGGTSNHMRRAELEAVGGWDAYNVTEDADLAFRLAALGGRIGWIAPPTKEEAVSSLRPWMRQRSRWIKGYIQTWLVHMNRPLSGGWRRVVMLQLTLGLSLLSVLFYAPVILYLTLFAIASFSGLIESPMPGVYLGALGVSLACGMAVGAIGAVRAGQFRLLAHVPLMPLYWLMLFPPFMAALFELRTRPFHWHKTEHGVTAAPPGKTGR
ncbi:glycosyl transferase [Algimonas porphyrae]|uniref:Glycosyl transferase n=2 Tax=Algimonas porphyrae TaxID=1128113 RepID=A0ABQ5V5H1_9PROT|nr:glycosyl transferase [Algimonas porphyrae]